ncbi:MAG: hypothetical protein NTX03_08360 [Bacteroidetes bacterium]|nr:hypothetical protein [Bacteroidota bacterium]
MNNRIWILLVFAMFALNLSAQKDTLYIYEVSPEQPEAKEVIKFRKLHAKIYMAAINGAITAYKDRKLTQKIPPKDVKSQGTVKVKVQISLDAEDPDKLTDTFETKTVDLETIDEYFVVGVWATGQEPKITAIAPAYKENLLDPHYKAQFWLSYEECTRLFNQPEMIALREKFLNPPKY